MWSQFLSQISAFKPVCLIMICSNVSCSLEKLPPRIRNVLQKLLSNHDVYNTESVVEALAWDCKAMIQRLGMDLQ